MGGGRGKERKEDAERRNREYVTIIPYQARPRTEGEVDTVRDFDAIDAPRDVVCLDCDKSWKVS